MTLSEAVSDWLSYMGVAIGVKTLDKGKLGHELKVSTPGIDSLHDLTHVGVGVSQVLPILVLSLISDSGFTLIFEQPELHLHPKVQTRLADFFVSLAMLKKQCIVETHSEYLINRLRYQVVLSNGDELSKDIILYFVDKPDKYSIFNRIKINKYGVIEKWPQGFFDESESIAASMLKASLEKKEKRNIVSMPNIFIDPFLFACPKVEEGKISFEAYIHDLLEWKKLKDCDWANIYILRETYTILAKQNDYPIWDDIKDMIKTYNIDYVQPDAIVTLVNSFLTKFTQIESTLDIVDILAERINTEPSNHIENRSKDYQEIYKKTLVYMFLK